MNVGLTTKVQQIKINGEVISNAKIKELQPEYQSKIGVKVASESIKNNGIDEIFFEKNNKKYVIYSDNIKVNDFKTGNIPTERPVILIDNKPVKLIKVQNEQNTMSEKAKSLTVGALKSGFANGVGCALGGILIGALKMGPEMKKGAIIGFISGFAWGVGCSLVADSRNFTKPDYSTIDEITK